MSDHLVAHLAPFHPSPVAGLKALLLSAGIGIGLSLLSIWPDNVIVSAVVIGVSALTLPVIYGATSRSIILRVIFGLLGSLIGLACLWGVRYALEFSMPQLMELVQQGPVAFVEGFMASSDRFLVATDRVGGGSSQGPSREMMAWMGGTAILGLMPILGALQGPKAMQALRGMRNQGNQTSD